MARGCQLKRGPVTGSATYQDAYPPQGIDRSADLAPHPQLESSASSRELGAFAATGFRLRRGGYSRRRACIRVPMATDLRSPHLLLVGYDGSDLSRQAIRQ